MSDEVVTEISSEDDLADSNELIPDSFEDNLKTALTTAPKRFLRAIGGKIKAFGPWLLGVGSGIRSFFTNPRQKSKNVYAKLRRELDMLTTVQLLAVLITFNVLMVS